MLDAAELRAAVGARERMGSPGGASSVGTKVDEYAMDTSELWMLAAYNTRVLDGGNAQGVDALTDDGSLSNRTSVASSGTITGVEGATVAAKLGALVEKEKKKADAAAGKRDSVNSAVSSIPSSTGSAATRVSKLPGLAGSKLPASRLRESTTVKTSGLPKPGTIGTPSKSRLMSPGSSVASPKAPTKINFNATPPQSPLVARATGKTMNKRLSITPGSYSAPTRNSSSGYISGMATGGRTTASPTIGTYKPRGFKKFNDDFGESPSPRSAISSRTATPGRTPVTTTTTRTPTAAAKRPGMGLAKPPTGGRMGPPFAQGVPPAGPGRTHSDASSTGGGGGGGLDRWRSPVPDRASVESIGSAGGLDRWRNKDSASDAGGNRLDRWRRSGEEVAEGTVSGGGASNLDKWRRSGSSEELIGAGEHQVVSGLDKWRKSTTTGVGASRMKAPSTTRR